MSFDLRISSVFNGYNAERVQNYPDLHTLPDLPRITLENINTLIISPYDKKVLANTGINSKKCSFLSDISWSTKHENSLELNSYSDYSKLCEILDNYDSIILINALEYLQDIRPTMSAIRKTLFKGAKNVILIGNKFQVGQSYGYRQWSTIAIAKLFSATGFIVGNKSESDKLYHLNLSCNKEHYKSFLATQELPDNNFNHLIITTEHSSYRVTGGIGSYVKECEELYGNDAAILIVDSNKDIELEKIRQNRWFAPQLFLEESTIDEYNFANYDTIADVVYETIKSILLFYEFESIESQELCLYTTISAKLAALVPKEIKIITTCHGSSFHLAKAKRDVLELENIHVAYREKFTIEKSDIVFLPTHFLKNSYINSGIENLDDASRIIKRLPFDISKIPEGAELIKYKRLIYIGKTSTIKGFDLFLETLITFHDNYPEASKQIEEVLIYATSIDIKEKYLIELYKKVQNLYVVRAQSLSREGLLNELAETSKDSLALVTYRGDNHAMVILELLGIGHDFLAALAGGSPELIPSEFKSNFLVEPSKEKFTERLNDCLSDVKYRSANIKNARKDYISEQKIINNSYTLENLHKYPLLKSINSVQLTKSEKIYVEIVDTGSKEDIEKTLKSLENQSIETEINIVPSPAVSGKLSYDYIRVYSGDIIRPNTLLRLKSFLYSDKSFKAVTGFEIVPTYENKEYLGNSFFIPYPPEMGSVFMQEKYARRLVVLFKKGTNLLPSDYTDWQRTIDIYAKNGRLGVLPELVFELTNSYSISFDQLENFSKMSHSFTILPVFDAYILNYQLKRLDDMYFGSQLFNHLEDTFIRKDHPSITYDLSPEMKRIALIYEHRAPKVIKKIFSVTAKHGYRTVKKIKKAIKRQ